MTDDLRASAGPSKCRGPGRRIHPSPTGPGHLFRDPSPGAAGYARAFRRALPCATPPESGLAAAGAGVRLRANADFDCVCVSARARACLVHPLRVHGRRRDHHQHHSCGSGPVKLPWYTETAGCRRRGPRRGRAQTGKVPETNGPAPAGGLTRHARAEAADDCPQVGPVLRERHRLSPRGGGRRLAVGIDSGVITVCRHHSRNMVRTIW